MKEVQATRKEEQEVMKKEQEVMKEVQATRKEEQEAMKEGLKAVKEAKEVMKEASEAMKKVQATRKEEQVTIKERYEAALCSLTEQVKNDPNIIAIVLSGSLAYGTVWERSDIDLTILVRDGSIPRYTRYSVEEQGIAIEMIVMEVKTFKEEMKRYRAGEFTHGYYGKSRIVFTKDPSLITLLEETKTVGMEDAVISCLPSIQFLITNINRAEKWVTALHDALYAQHFLQWCAVTVGEIVLLLHGEEPDRESILRAEELEPELMEQVYRVTCAREMTEDEIRLHVAYLRQFILDRLDIFSVPIIRYLSDREVRSASEFKNYFGQEIVSVLILMSENGLIERVTKPAKLFKHSNVTIEEMAFFIV